MLDADVGVAAVCICLVAWTSLVLGCNGFLKDAFWESAGSEQGRWAVQGGKPTPRWHFPWPWFPLLFFLPKLRSVETVCCSLPPPPRKHVVGPPGKMVHC